MNVDLQSLQAATPHPLKSFFKNYSRAQLAKKLGVTSGYLTTVLCGHARPSDDLEAKIQELASAIEAAEAAEV